MRLRAKTKRRLIVLLVASVAIAASLGGYVAFRVGQLRARARHAGEVGMAAAKVNDYETALPNLGQYLGRFSDDPDALYYCAIAREHIETANGSNFYEAVQYYRRAIQLCPPSGRDWLEDAQRRLLKLYVAIYANTYTRENTTTFYAEAIDLADTLNKAIPNDRDALFYKAFVQFQQRDRAALDTIRLCNEFHPLDFESHLLELQIRQRSGAKPGDLVDVANAFVKAHPEDPGLLVLQSRTYSIAGDIESAKRVAISAQEHDLPNAASLSLLINQLDALELFHEAISLAVRAADKHPQDVEYQRILASRLLVAQDYPQFDSRWGGLDPSKAESDEQLVVLKGLSLAFRDRKDEAESIFKSLAKRNSPKTIGSLAQAITQSATALWFGQDDLKLRAEACRKSLSVDRQNAFLHFMLGEVYALQRNMNNAYAEWISAGELAPAWSLPCKRVAQLYLSARRSDKALEIAQKADLRQPNDQEINVMLAKAKVGMNDTGKPDQTAALLSSLQQMRAKFPAAEELPPLMAILRAILGQKDQAIGELRTTLQFTPPASEDTFLFLVQISDHFNLGLEEECYKRSEEVHGLSPTLGFSKAWWLLEKNRSPEGLAILEAQASKKDASASWRLVYVRYLELVKDPRAKASWMALANKFTDDTEVQLAALSAASVQGESEFLEATIKRYREQVGEDNVDGRMAQAIWLIHGDKTHVPTEKQLTEASLILKDVARSAPNPNQARMLLADCLSQLGNIPGMIEQLRIVAIARPEDLSLALRLASLLSEQGDAAGREQLARLSQYPSSLAQKQQAALLYVDLGNQDKAMQLLQAESDPNTRLVLAQIHMQKYEFREAEAICAKLMQTPNAALIGVYSTCLALQGKKAEAEAVLAKLDTVEAQPGIRELVRARYLSQFGKPEDALAQFLAATKAVPSDSNAWRQLVIFCISVGRIEEAVGYLAEARKAVSGDPGFDALNGLVSQLRQLGTEADKRMLFVALLQAPRDVTALTSAIELASAVKANARPPATLVPQVKDLADKSPKVLAIQLFAAQYLNSVGQFDDAIAITTRANLEFPNSADIARVATVSLANAQKWNEAIASANQWRQRDPSNAIQADAMIANADNRLGNFDAAIRQLEPYMDLAKAAPNDYATIILFSSQAMLATKQTDRAAQLLEPLLTMSEWRLRWIGLMVAIPDPAGQVKWLDRVASAIPADIAIERVQLASGYQQLANATKNPALEEKSRSIIGPIAASPSVEPNVLFAVAVLYEGQKDFVNAAKVYNRILNAVPDHAEALNNLAMILANSDKDLPEALSYAQRAVKIAPLAPCYDTQANVYLRLKDYDNAVASINEAIKVDPNNLEWQATRIWILALSPNRRGDADKEFQQLQSAKAIDKLSDSSRARLAQVGLK